MALVKYNNNSLSSVTSTASFGGAITLIKTLTASSSSTLSFVDGSSDVVLDSTYPIYLFKFINIHPATDQVKFQFNMSADTGSNYNVAKTTSFYEAFHREDDGGTSLGYLSAVDLAQGTGFQDLIGVLGNNNDDNCNGELRLFNLSSTTFVKHYTSRLSGNYRAGLGSEIDQYGGGYGNTTSAVDAIQFKMSSGNIDSGTIKLYGIKDS